MSNKRSIWKKSGGLRRAMVMHFVPQRSHSKTLCGRDRNAVFWTRHNLRLVGCKACLMAAKEHKP